MRDISDASGVSKPLIYHHFGSKEGLYAAVKWALVASGDRRGVGIDRSDERPADPQAELRRLYEVFRGNEALLRICAWSRLERDPAGGAGGPALLEPLSRRLALAQEQRIIRGDINPGNLALMLVGLIAVWLEARSPAAEVLEAGPDGPAYLREAAALVGRGLAPDRAPA